MNNEIKLTIPKYLDSFQCMGGDCSDTCCRGWNVYIDKRTYKKYRNLNTSDLGNRLAKYICKNKQSTRDGDYAYIQLDKGQCPFLTSTCRCEIQEKVGHSYLSKTCQTYPRQLIKIGDEYEMTAGMSCPVIAEQVLLGKNPFLLIQKEIRSNEFSGLALSQNLKEDEVSKKIRTFFIKVVQDSRFSFQERLILVVMFAHAIATEKSVEMEQFLSESSLLLSSPNLKEEVTGLRNFASVNQALKNFVKISKKQISSGNELNVFILMLNESLKGLSFERKQDVSNFAKDRLVIQKTSDGKYIDQILENYTIHYLMQEIKSYTPERVMSYVEQLLVRISFFKVLWFGLNENFGEVSAEQLIQTVQKFTKNYEHSQAFKDSMTLIFEDLDEVQLTDYLALII